MLLVLYLALFLLGAIAMLYMAFKDQAKSMMVITSLFGFAVVGIYVCLGGYKQYQGYQEMVNRERRAQKILATIKSPQALIDKLKLAIAKRPNDAKGYYLLARLYVAQNNMSQAADAISYAYRLAPHDFNIAFEHMELSYLMAGEFITSDVSKLIDKLKRLKPGSVDIAVFLMRDAYRHHDYVKVSEYGNQVLAKLEQGSKLYNEVKSLLLALEKNKLGEERG